MKIVIQRVKNAQVEVDGETVGKIKQCFLEIARQLKMVIPKSKACYLDKKIV